MFFVIPLYLLLQTGNTCPILCCFCRYQRNLSWQIHQPLSISHQIHGHLRFLSHNPPRSHVTMSPRVPLEIREGSTDLYKVYSVSRDFFNALHKHETNLLTILTQILKILRKINWILLLVYTVKLIIHQSINLTKTTRSSSNIIFDVQ